VGVLLLAVVVVVAIVAWSRREGGFSESFATLLDRPVAGGGGVASWLTGREHVGGEFGARPVVLSLHRKRGRYQLGYLIVAMQPKAAPAQAGTEPPFIWDLVRDPEGREALSQLEKHHGLKLAFEDGWIKATWMPVGLFVFFPGRFVAERWQAVLAGMQQVAASIERRTATA